MKIILRKSNGITLIALVITIIVLLILAGVTIASLTGENGLLQRATDAKTNSDDAQIKERIQLAYHSALIAGQGNYTKESLEEELEKEFGEDNYSVDDSDNTEWILTGKNNGKEQSITISAGTKEASTVNKFKEGDYVLYTYKDNNEEETLKCMVIYDSKSDYGIQIIPLRAFEDVVLGEDDNNVPDSITNRNDMAMYSYNNAVEKLNKMSEKYWNKDLAQSVRSVGSDPNSTSKVLIDSDNTISQTAREECDGKLKQGDDKYLIDYAKLQNLEILKTDNNKGYWLASRNADRLDYDEYNLTIRGILPSGKISQEDYWDSCLILIEVYSVQTYSETLGLRPVFNLYPQIKVVKGDGTSSSPYEISK